MFFPVSDITCSPLLPFFSAFVVSLCCSVGGVSGGFLLVPFQISILGITQPCVSATNHVFNLLACPSGIYRFWREGRFVWPLALLLIIGTMPGVFLGAWVKTRFLQDILHFSLFVGFVLLFIALRMLLAFLKEKRKAEIGKPTSAHVICQSSLSALDFTFQGVQYHLPCLPVFVLSLIVGVIGGIYGIGGGAIMGPFLVAGFGLPVYITAGSTLCATFVASFTGVASYLWLAAISQSTVGPDWTLGLLMGLGGVLGTYCGARLQRFVPHKLLKALLLGILLYAGCYYLVKGLLALV